MTDKCKCSVFTKPSYLSKIVAWTQSSLTCSLSSCSRGNTSRPVCWCQAHTGTCLQGSREFLSASKRSIDDGLVMFGGLKRKNQKERESGSLMLKCFLCLISTLFRFGLFQQLRVPSEYQALPSTVSQERSQPIVTPIRDFFS